jgi:hypothetical protein
MIVVIVVYFNLNNVDYFVNKVHSFMLFYCGINSLFKTTHKHQN